MIEYSWVAEARKYIGLKEIPGPKHNSIIQGWLKRLNAWWSDDETPWCGVFVAQCLQAVDIKYPGAWYRAKAYLDWGDKIDMPEYGCVVVFTREGGGHVGFVVGKDDKGRIMVLGGNQGNAVSIAPFELYRVSGYRWPTGYARNKSALPVIASSASSSRNEA